MSYEWLVFATHRANRSEGLRQRPAFLPFQSSERRAPPAACVVTSPIPVHDQRTSDSVQTSPDVLHRAWSAGRTERSSRPPPFGVDLFTLPRREPRLARRGEQRAADGLPVR